MKQLIASSVEQALSALENGCRWIHFLNPEELDKIIPACKEAKAIVTIPGKYTQAKDTRVHGVILSYGDMGGAEAREYLGPDAIIGCHVRSLFEIMNLAAADVDFFVLEASKDDFRQILSMAREKGVEQRICALTDNEDYLAEGADALLTSKY